MGRSVANRPEKIPSRTYHPVGANAGSCETGWYGEQRLKSGEQTVDRVGHERTKQGEDQGAGLEFALAVQHLDPEDRGPDGGTENCRQSRGHSHQEQQARLLHRAPHPAGVGGCYTGADQRGRSLAPRRAAGADGDRRSHGLDQRHPRPDHPVQVVKSIDDRIGAVAFGFRREAIHQEAGQQSAHGGGQGNEPEAVRPHQSMRNASLGEQFRHAVAGQPAQEQSLAGCQQSHEHLRSERSHHAHQHAIDQKLTLPAHPPDTFRGCYGKCTFHAS